MSNPLRYPEVTDPQPRLIEAPSVSALEPPGLLRLTSALAYAPDWDPGRVPYKLTAGQVIRMVEAGIIPDDVDVELWDGVLYTMTKGELHNAVVTRIAELLRPLTPAGYHVREEKSSRRDEHSLPEPDVAVCAGGVFDYLPDPPPLEKLSLVVEVNLNSPRADHVTKPLGYAAVGIPAYWIVDVEDRAVVVCTRPTRRVDETADYADRVTRAGDDRIEVVIGGEPRGTIRVDDMLPPPARP
jgi:Uma2 family endonuclease